MSNQYLTTNDGIRVRAAGPSNASSDSSDAFAGSFIDEKTGHRAKYIDRVLHYWDGARFVAADTRVTDSNGGRVIDADSISKLSGQARIDAYRAALDQQNRDALARSGLDDPTEAAIASSMAAVEHANALVVSGENPERDRYLKMVREANERALRETGSQK